MPKLSKLGMWLATLVSAPGAILAVLVVLSQATAFMTAATLIAPASRDIGILYEPLRLGGLYITYLAGMGSGFICLRRHNREIIPRRERVTYSVIGVLGLSASIDLELIFWHQTKIAVPHGYLAATSLLWVCFCLMVWIRDRNGGSRMSSPASDQQRLL